MTETRSPPEAGTVVDRLRERLASISPLSLGMLGFLGIPGEVVPGLEVLKLFSVFWLFWLWPFVAMLIGAVRQSLGDDESAAGPRDWLEMDSGWRGLFAMLYGLSLSVLNPLMGRQDVMQLLGSAVAVVRHRGSLPAPESFTQSGQYRLPVEGAWTVVNGSPIKEHSHSWYPATQRYAYDLVITDDDGRTRPAEADTSVENYYCYDKPVLAPADGVVVDVRDGDPELGRAGGFSHPGKRSITGNAVTIRHAEGEYSTLVHLVPGSIVVEPGERVDRGQEIGRCGHSGNSSEPHLHVQLQDHPTFEFAAGLPIRFEDVAVETPGVDVAEATGWDAPEGTGQYIHVGQRVTHVADGQTDRTDDGSRDPEPATAPALGGVRRVAGLANGIAVGGFVTVLAGVVGASLTTAALLVGGLAGLGLASLGARLVVGNGSVHSASVGTVGGVGLAALAVGAFAGLSALPTVAPVALGAGLFLTGAVLYGGSWEYGRWRGFQHAVRSTVATE